MATDVSISPRTPVKLTVSLIILGAISALGFVYGTIAADITDNTEQIQVHSQTFSRQSQQILTVQHNIDESLLELRHNRERLTEHIEADGIRSPADVREAMRE